MKWRKPRLDPKVAELLQLAPKERILEWVNDGDGRTIVASETALHLQRQPPDYTRIGWDEIEHASYSDGSLTIVLTPALGGATLRLPVGPGPQLPVVVRDRVTASVVIDRFEPIVDESGVRVVGRRSGDGAITWRSDLSPDLVGDPAAEQAARRAMQAVQAEVAASEPGTQHSG